MFASPRSSTVRAALFVIAATLLHASGIGASEPTAEQKQVIQANEAFYAAFRNRDMAAMDALWSRSDRVAVIHPGWAGLMGREPVMDSWRLILEAPSSPKIRSVNPEAHVYGDFAFVVCYEVLGGGFLIATNIFVREEGEWRLVHHQAGPTPAPPGVATETPI